MLVIDANTIRGLQVSAHFLVRRDGRVQQFVSTDRRAWHAGVSSWQGRPNCNDYSVGIELEGLEGWSFEPAQYRSLAQLLRALLGAGLRFDEDRAICFSSERSDKATVAGNGTVNANSRPTLGEFANVPPLTVVLPA